MPGTIQVSVLEFMALQSSSSLAEMSIKISMSKREYQTWEKGDFYLMLKEKKYQIQVGVEKGIWYEIFPVEGVGYVHMKLQFVLNEEDRNRIQIMNEFVLRPQDQTFLY